MNRTLINPVLILFVILFISSCSKANNVPVGDGSAGGKDNMPLFKSSDFSAKKLFPEALKIAKKWRSDAELYDVTAEYRIEANRLTPSLMNFNFASTQVKQGGLIVETSGNGWSDRFEENLSLIGYFKPIDMGELRIDNAEALAIAEAAGGAATRKKREPDEIDIFLTNDDHLIWNAHYGYIGSPESGKRFLIEGVGGKLMGTT